MSEEEGWEGSGWREGNGGCLVGSIGFRWKI
jgi:hypothetical protein